MDKKEFVEFRHYLGKSQRELARLLGISKKAVQSFEQGWRNIPAYAERQLLFMVFLKRLSGEKSSPCWEILDCPAKWRENCAAWEFKAGHFCWFINGTFCEGEYQENWGEKTKTCQKCKVFLSMLSVPLGMS